MMISCGNMQGAMQYEPKFFLGMSLDGVEGELNKLPVFSRRNLVRYWCNGFKSNNCEVNCTECQAIVLTPPNVVVFIEGRGEVPRVTKIEESNYKIFNYLNSNHYFSYDIAVTIVKEEVIEGMTLKQVKAARPDSKFEEKYWCNLRQVSTKCDETCARCGIVMYEFDRWKRRLKTIYLNSYGYGGSIYENGITVKKIDYFHNHAAIPY